MDRSDKANNKSSKIEISKNRKYIFNVILIAFAFFLIVLLEFGLRVFNYGNDLQLFQKSQNYPAYYEINQDVNLRYFSKIINTTPTNDIFLIDKPDTCFRIFVFGGSTTRGFPYQAGTAFPRILYFQLQDAFPDKRIEVINLSASALNSYTYIDLIDEVLQKEPDAILVYGGHNEYYGALGVGSAERGGNNRWVKKLHLRFSKLRSYQLVQNLIGKIASKDDAPTSATLMQRIVKDQEILFQSDQFYDGINQFEKNMTELVKKARRKDVPVILSELVSNIEDQKPFESVATDDLPPADSIYKLGIQLIAKGDYTGAKELLYKAKDLDVIRFRAPEAFNEVIQKISEEYELPLVAMEQIFENHSPDQLIGNELILEHLHPTIDGQFLMADAFFKSMEEHKLISPEWNQSNILPISFYRNNWGFTALDSLIGDLGVKLLQAGWPFKIDEGPNRFLETYKYNGYVDSMAFAYVSMNDKHIEDEHIKLANYYYKKGMPGKAYEEYRSLIKLHPYITDLYFEATKFLIAQKRYQEALDLINSAPLMKHDYFYYYMQGTLKVKLYMTDEAINNLEKSLELIPNDEDPLKILKPLYVAYGQIGDQENRKRILELIREINPKFEQENILKRRLRPDIDLTYGDVLNKGIELIGKKEFKNAETLLLSLNKVEETYQSTKYLCLANIMLRDFETAYEYGLKSYKLNPEDIENCNNLFSLCLSLKKFDMAVEVLEQLRNLNISQERYLHLKELFDNRIKDTASKE